MLKGQTATQQQKQSKHKNKHKYITQQQKQSKHKNGKNSYETLVRKVAYN